MRPRGRGPLLAAPVAALLVALTAGCAQHGGSGAAATPGTGSSAAPSAGPSGLAGMRQKVDAAESAAAAAEKDASSDPDR